MIEYDVSYKKNVKEKIQKIKNLSKDELIDWMQTKGVNCFYVCVFSFERCEDGTEKA